MMQPSDIVYLDNSMLENRVISEGGRFESFDFRGHHCEVDWDENRAPRCGRRRRRGARRTKEFMAEAGPVHIDGRHLAADHAHRAAAAGRSFKRGAVTIRHGSPAGLSASHRAPRATFNEAVTSSLRIANLTAVNREQSKVLT